MRHGQGTGRLAAPIEDKDGRARDGVSYDLVAVTSKELPPSGDAHHAGAVRIHPSAMPVRAQEHLSARMPCTDRVKASIAKDDREGRGFEVGARRGPNMVRGINSAARYFEVPLVSGFACLGVEEAGEVGLNVMRVALGPFCYVGLDGFVGPRLKRSRSHLAMVLDEGGDNFRRAVMDALGRVTVAEQDKRISASQLGDLRLSVLPAGPEPSLMMIVAESNCVAANDFRVWRHEADRAAAVQIADHDQQLRAR